MSPAPVPAPAGADVLSPAERAQIVEQLELLRLDPANADVCGALGLLASVADGDGRYIVFCGDGSILQGSVANAEPLPMDDLEPLAFYLRVAPEGAPVPRTLVGRDQLELVASRELADGPVIVSDPNISDIDLSPAPQADAVSCPNIASYCASIEDWAEEFSGPNSWNSHWCSGTVSSSQRTASAQLGHVGHDGVWGRQYVRPCSGEAVLFQGQHKNPCTGAWDSTFNWLATGGWWLMKLSQRYHNLCNQYDTDLRFKTSGGYHRYTGAFRTFAVG